MRTAMAMAIVWGLVVTAVAAQDPETLRARAVPPVTDADDGAYRLVPGDTISIKFMHNPELTEDQVQIRPDGRISMPLIGELLVAGASVNELATRLGSAYEDMLRSPSITIQVRSFADRRVFVGGEVQRPGMLPLVGRQTAMSAVMEAGGLKSSAKRSEVLVIRRGDEDAPRVLRLSMEQGPKGEGPEAANFGLQPLDVVLVTESGIARAGRAMDQYVRQLLPVALTGGFSWLLGDQVFGGGR
jgi:polysaccharide biosynthesis/export protein